jgi:nucleoside-diphosphate-sugar epimerase
LGDVSPSAGTEAIVHLEVKQHVQRPMLDDVAEFKRVNVDGTQAWLEWASRHKVKRFIYISSIKAVGAGPGNRLEDDSQPPDTPYGETKAAAEALVKAWTQNDAERVATILRPAPVYGPGNEANLAAFVRQVSRGRPCFVGSGSTRKSLAGRANVVAAIEYALARDCPGVAVFNVSDPEVISVRELAELVAELGKWPKPRGISMLAARALAMLGDGVEALSGRSFPLTTPRLRSLLEESVFPCDKLVSAGFRHPLTLREGLKEMVDRAASLATED